MVRTSSIPLNIIRITAFTLFMKYISRIKKPVNIRGEKKGINQKKEIILSMLSCGEVMFFNIKAYVTIKHTKNNTVKMKSDINQVWFQLFVNQSLNLLPKDSRAERIT